MGTMDKFKEGVEDLVMSLIARLPGKMIIWLILSVLVLFLFILGFSVGLGSASLDSCSGSVCPQYSVLPNNSASCPALLGDKLLTTLAQGESWEGLVVLLQCEGTHTPYPTSVRCMRTSRTELQWSHLPVCHPSSLVSIEYWKESIHARSVSCSGDSVSTVCHLTCMAPYVAVESAPYTCTSLPCQAWTISGGQCYICDSSCRQLHNLTTPGAGEVLASLGCDQECTRVVVTSHKGAALWQSKRTGVFSLIGEHNGRPIYLKNSTSEYLYYNHNITEWLIGDDYHAVRGGINLFNNDDKTCPERHGGETSKKLYLDYSYSKDNMWQEDDSIQVSCYHPGSTDVPECKCSQYTVLYSSQATNNSLVKYHQGHYTLLDSEDSYSLLSPVYYNTVKQLYLFSHHPAGLVWTLSASMTVSPIRGVGPPGSCPDASGLAWEWYSSTGEQGQQVYTRDTHKEITVTCTSH